MAPFFAVQQVRFTAKSEGNSTIYLRFFTPPYAVITQIKWFMLDAPDQCPVFGKAMLCQNLQYELIDFRNCLRVHETNSAQCPMITCSGTECISTPVGALIRTKEPFITIASQKSTEVGRAQHHIQTISSVSDIEVPAYQVVFVQ